MHIFVVVFAQVKVQVRPGVRISKPTVHHNVSSGKALAAQGSAPTQASPPVSVNCRLSITVTSMGVTPRACLQIKSHDLETLHGIDCVHILVVLFAQVKAQARPGICILKPLAHFNVLSGKAIAEQGSVPTQASPLVSS